MCYGGVCNWPLCVCVPCTLTCCLGGRQSARPALSGASVRLQGCPALLRLLVQKPIAVPTRAPTHPRCRWPPQQRSRSRSCRVTLRHKSHISLLFPLERSLNSSVTAEAKFETILQYSLYSLLTSNAVEAPRPQQSGRPKGPSPREAVPSLFVHLADREKAMVVTRCAL